MQCLESQTPWLESQLHHALHVEFGDVIHMLLVKHNYYFTGLGGRDEVSEEVFEEDLALGLP